MMEDRVKQMSVLVLLHSKLFLPLLSVSTAAKNSDDDVVPLCYNS
jgi:hypothetical protein